MVVSFVCMWGLDSQGCVCCGLKNGEHICRPLGIDVWGATMAVWSVHAWRGVGIVMVVSLVCMWGLDSQGLGLSFRVCCGGTVVPRSLSFLMGVRVGVLIGVLCASLWDWCVLGHGFVTRPGCFA
jgi:hypothetical protein